MRIERNPKREGLLLDAIRASFADSSRARQPERIHLSDLLTPRKAYWQRVDPRPATDDECLYWVAGRGHEDALGRIAGLVVAPEAEQDGVVYRPDFVWWGVPAEFKTRRSNLAKPGEEALTYETYLNQLRGYCALRGVTTGTLVVLSLLEGRSANPMAPTRPELAVYEVTFDPAELEAERGLLSERRDFLVRALVAWSLEQFFAALGGRPIDDADRSARWYAQSALPLCPEWQCGRANKAVEKQPWCLDCRREFSNDSTAARHQAATRHTVRPAAVRWEYQPRCKWYEVCRPYVVDATRGARDGGLTKAS